jgi:hypothetical protein
MLMREIRHAFKTSEHRAYKYIHTAQVLAECIIAVAVPDL